MGNIKILSKELINLIAAGEVVERPASVIKELMENSIDAKAKSIIVSVEEAGLKSIVVKDDGIGMSREDASLAFIQHATSKLSTQKDLENIMSLGFRGEALASIAEVSLESIIDTKNETTNAVKVIYKEKSLNEQKSSKQDHGTNITITGLFENIPARKKFLKKENTELKNIINMFIQVALPFTDIHFELYSNGTLVHRLTKTSDLKKRIYEIWGEKVASNLYLNESDSIDGMKIYGLIGNTSLGKARNDLQYTYINSRYVKSGIINSAIGRAYQGFLHRDLRPTYFLFLQVDPKSVDVNIHPRKLEVKFEDEQKVFLDTMRFVKTTLESNSKQQLLQNISNNQPDPVGTTDNWRTGAQMHTGKKLGYIVRDSGTEMPRYGSSKKQKINEAMSFTSELFAPNNEQNATVGANDHWHPTNEPIPQNLMQIFNTYIVFEKGDKFITIDQHAAAEKIVFEKLMKQYNDEGANDHSRLLTKPLLTPAIIELGNIAEKREVMEKKDFLASVGFVIDDFGGNSIQINEIPEIIEKPNYQEILEGVIDEESLGVDTEEDKLNIYHVSKEVYLMFANLACHGSIRAGQKLSASEMQNIIKSLLALDNPGNCPHGRPTMWEISKYEFEKKFNRNI